MMNSQFSSVQEQIANLNKEKLPPNWEQLAAAKARQYYPWKGDKHDTDLAERHYGFMTQNYILRPEMLIEDILHHERVA